MEISSLFIAPNNIEATAITSRPVRLSCYDYEVSTSMGVFKALANPSQTSNINQSNYKGFKQRLRDSFFRSCGSWSFINHIISITRF